MKSKAEIIDALKRCNDFENHCNECPYDNNNSSEECIDELFNDIITLLSKSDFEVMKEILSRSNWLSFFVPDLPDDLGIKTLGLAFQEGRVFRIAFDADGNIL